MSKKKGRKKETRFWQTLEGSKSSKRLKKTLLKPSMQSVEELGEFIMGRSILAKQEIIVLLIIGRALLSGSLLENVVAVRHDQH